MPLKRSWKDFVRYSLEVFSPKKKNRKGEAVAAIAHKMFHQEIVERNLTLPIAFQLLSDPEFIAGIIDDVNQEWGEETGAPKIINGKTLSKIESGLSMLTHTILEENIRLHEKLDKSDEKLNKANELLVLARKRAIRYFKVGLMVSVSGIAIGVATRMGAFDGIKERFNDFLSLGQTTSEKRSEGALQHPFLPSTALPDCLNDDYAVARTFGNSNVCLRPNPPVVCKPQVPMRQPR